MCQLVSNLRACGQGGGGADAANLDAAGQEDQEEVGHVAPLLALLPVVEVEAGAEQVAEETEEEDGEHQ